MDIDKNGPVARLVFCMDFWYLNVMLVLFIFDHQVTMFLEDILYKFNKECISDDVINMPFQGSAILRGFCSFQSTFSF